MTPLRDDGVTIPGSIGAVRCSRCGVWFRARGRQRWCSAACRQAAFRQRLPSPRPAPPAMLRRGRHQATTVYACPHCDARTLGAQRCEDCNRFGVRVGWGGLCPACDQPVALVELVPELAPWLEGH